MPTRVKSNGTSSTYPEVIWDLDHPFERIVVESEVTPEEDAVSWINPNIQSSRSRKLITGIPGKPGIIWTMDAETGEFLWAKETNFQNVIVGVDIENHKGITNPDLRHHRNSPKKNGVSEHHGRD
jgi:alcohol dehydrogenase (cytochrome c)